MTKALDEVQEYSELNDPSEFATDKIQQELARLRDAKDLALARSVSPHRLSPRRRQPGPTEQLASAEAAWESVS